jgi:hypothetical protein
MNEAKKQLTYRVWDAEAGQFNWKNLTVTQLANEYTLCESPIGHTGWISTEDLDEINARTKRSFSNPTNMLSDEPI